MMKDKVLIERAAASLRRILFLDNIDNPDLASILNNDLGKIRPGLKLVRKIQDEMPEGTEAEFDSISNEIRFSETVWQRLLSGCTRARFTAAHELGHVVLGHEGIRRRDVRGYITAKVAIQENEANAFAGYFLVPTDRALEIKNQGELEQNFQLGSIAAEIRFKELESAKRKISGKKRKLPDCVIDFMKESEKRGHRFRSLPDEFRD
ncbi:MAG: ImmA/IrrE family metallo-endopeptidase [Salaquimonas sp.]